MNEKKFNKEKRIIYDTIINQVLNPNDGNLSYSYKNLHFVDGPGVCILMYNKISKIIILIYYIFIGYWQNFFIQHYLSKG